MFQSISLLKIFVHSLTTLTLDYDLSSEILASEVTLLAVLIVHPSTASSYNSGLNLLIPMVSDGLT